MLTKAYRVDQLVAAGPFKRAWLYMQINKGRLPARRVDGVVFVMEDDWRTFLDSAAPARRSDPLTDSPMNEVVRSFDDAVAQINDAGSIVAAAAPKLVA